VKMAARNVNIGGNSADPTYRYKMPALSIKPEGKGRTAIVNIWEISKCLKCDPTYPTHFFGLELGAPARYDKARTKTVINGHHGQIVLARLLDRFIGLFILCPTCALPEVTLAVHKRAIKMDCAA
jgi:translation initiation factor 5